MKKVRLVSVIMVTMILAGCSEKTQYEQAVLQQMQQDKDIKDYHIAPEKMVQCVVMTSSKDMPGMIPIDPMRKQAYKNYTRMLTLTESEDPKKTLEELRKDFGSPKALAEAHANYAESVVECMSGLVTGTEEELENKAE
ncbi:MAG: hypothetical protein M0R33_14720 [Methylomonas sp.]|jgi:hypothetical protein|uniref:hypothetical protein n=1 Tax=Methylomonas sp. TaxID=418 RepID=UPI0026009192|nr:hypothetical protein [Methylomonas sp.]MCK9607692.1 hypothetical protein [Methylomonas sp.]